MSICPYLLREDASLKALCKDPRLAPEGVEWSGGVKW